MPSSDTRDRIAAYIRSVIGGRKDQLIVALPHTMPRWGKLRIAQRGDSIRTLTAIRNFSRLSFRDNTFVRVSFDDFFRQDTF